MGHTGKNRTKSLMHCYFYWPHMDKDIVNMSDSCHGCALTAKAPATVNRGQKRTNRGNGPKLTLQVFLDDQYYLIVVDSHTKQPEVLKCKRPTTN